MDSALGERKVIRTKNSAAILHERNGFILEQRLENSMLKGVVKNKGNLGGKPLREASSSMTQAKQNNHQMFE